MTRFPRFRQFFPNANILSKEEMTLINHCNKGFNLKKINKFMKNDVLS